MSGVLIMRTKRLLILILTCNAFYAALIPLYICEGVVVLARLILLEVKR